MKLLRAVFFLSKLIVSLLPDLLRLILAQFPWRVATLSVLILALSAGSTIWILSRAPVKLPLLGNQRKKTTIETFLLPHSTDLPILVSEAQQLSLPSTNSVATINAWEHYLLSQQAARPLHRDVLVNLGILAWKQSRFDDAKAYWYQAWKLDPTTPTLKPLFAEFSQR